MKAPTTWYELSWPREVTARPAPSVLLRPHDGLRRAVRPRGHLSSWCGRPPLGLVDRDLGGLLEQLHRTLPGLGLIPVARSPLPVRRAWEVRLSSRTRSLNTENAEPTARAVLGALAQVGKGESLTLQWVFGRSLVPYDRRPE